MFDKKAADAQAYSVGDYLMDWKVLKKWIGLFMITTKHHED